jgi:hypothetical protein
VGGQPVAALNHGLTTMAMPRETIIEQPVSVLDRYGIDRLLAALIAKHGEARADIAPELAAARAKRWENAYIKEASCNEGRTT